MGPGVPGPAARQSLDGAEGGLTPDAFERLVAQLAREIPETYLEGISAIDVSPRVVPHPDRPGVFTLGHCVPVADIGDELTSRIVLYYGSFQALARDMPDFDWRFEAWETLTHEVRHHLEWRAHADDLEDYDWAVEQNLAREAGEPFDPVFYLAGERVSPDTRQVEDDVFIDRLVRRLPAQVTFAWRGRRWEADVPTGTLPLFLAMDGLPVPPPGELIVVLRRAASLLEVFRTPSPPRHDRAVARRAAND